MKLKNEMKYLILVTLFAFFSCKKNDIQKIKADLIFRSISFASAYGANEEQYNNLIKEIDSTLEDNKNSDDETVKLYKHFSKLKKYDLLKSPYIFLRIKEDSIITIYLSEKEYDKVKNFKHIDLIKENKKVVLELDIEKKDSSIYYSNNIIKISKVDGRSRSNI